MAVRAEVPLTRRGGKGRRSGRGSGTGGKGGKHYVSEVSGKGKPSPLPEASALVAGYPSAYSDAAYSPVLAPYPDADLSTMPPSGSASVEPSPSHSLRGASEEGNIMALPDPMVETTWETWEEANMNLYQSILGMKDMYPMTGFRYPIDMPIKECDLGDWDKLAAVIDRLPYFMATRSKYKYELMANTPKGAFGHVRLVYRTLKIAGGERSLIALKISYDSQSKYAKRISRTDVATSAYLGQNPNPNLVQIIAYYVYEGGAPAESSESQNGGVIMVMEGIQGPCLLDVVGSYGQIMLSGNVVTRAVRQGVFKFFEATARALILGILVGVAHMHRYGMTHNDLKLENVMVEVGPFLKGDSSTVKIIDYGMGVPLDLTKPDDDMLIPCSGTPGYVTPEVWKNKVEVATADGGTEPMFKVAPRINDLYAVGMILWSMLHAMEPHALDGKPFPLFRDRAHVVFARYRISDDCAEVLDALTSPDWLRTADEVMQLPWFTRPEEELKAQILRNIGNRELYLKSFSDVLEQKGSSTYQEYSDRIRKDYERVSQDPTLAVPSTNAAMYMEKYK